MIFEAADLMASHKFDRCDGGQAPYAEALLRNWKAERR
jgi:hypothetical protein